MPGLKPPVIRLTPTLQKILEKIARCYTNPYYLVLWAKIILIAATGANPCLRMFVLFFCSSHSKRMVAV